MKKFKSLSEYVVLILSLFIVGIFMTSCNSQPNNDDYKIQVTPVDLKLNDGNFYLNGFKNSAYYSVKDGTIQLITDDKDKMREAYHAQMVLANINMKGIRTVTDGCGSPEDFEKWYNQSCQEWENPEPYMIVYSSYQEKNHIALHWSFSDDYTTGIYQSMDYIDENNFDWGEGCRFTRVEE